MQNYERKSLLQYLHHGHPPHHLGDFRADFGTEQAVCSLTVLLAPAYKNRPETSYDLMLGGVVRLRKGEAHRCHQPSCFCLDAQPWFRISLIYGWVPPPVTHIFDPTSLPGPGLPSGAFLSRVKLDVWTGDIWGRHIHRFQSVTPSTPKEVH